MNKRWKEILWLVGLWVWVSGARGADLDSPATQGPDARVFEETLAKTTKVRGLEFHESVPFKRIARDEVPSLFEEELRKQYTSEDFDHIRAALSMLGAVPPTLDVKKMLLAMMGDQVAGLYDPEKKEMRVVGNLSLEVSLVRIILEHELTHALTDQHFDLETLAIDETQQDDRSLAALCLVDGDATLSMVEYAKQMGIQGIFSTFLITLFMDQDSFYAAPTFYQGWLTFPYVGGERFLLELMNNYCVEEQRLTPRKHRLHGVDWEVVNFVYGHPPTSTEQILHPRKFFEGDDPPVEIDSEFLNPLIEKGWQVVWENTFGEFLIRTLLEKSLRLSEAHRSSQGWGGDRYYLLEREGQHLLVWSTFWDTLKDREEFVNSCVKINEQGKFPGNFLFHQPATSTGAILGFSSDLKQEEIKTLLVQP